MDFAEYEDLAVSRPATEQIGSLKHKRGSLPKSIRFARCSVPHERSPAGRRITTTIIDVGGKVSGIWEAHKS